MPNKIVWPLRYIMSISIKKRYVLRWNLAGTETYKTGTLPSPGELCFSWIGRLSRSYGILLLFFICLFAVVSLCIFLLVCFFTNTWSMFAISTHVDIWFTEDKKAFQTKISFSKLNFSTRNHLFSRFYQPQSSAIGLL